jgi:tetratricopeptide (TPR) repeat protein
MKNLFFLTLIFLVSCTGKQQDDSSSAVVLTGVDGRKFTYPSLEEQTRARLDSSLNVAQENFNDRPNEENYIWLGRREAYLYNYNRAIEIFSEGIEKFPESYKLYRHRGHRYITIREFDKAVADLQKAASLMPAKPLEIEPDGQPNKLNIPLSSTQFNVWYHLGLAHYLRGDFASASMAYMQCMGTSNNDDLMTATVDWLYMTYRRMGREHDANALLALIREDMKIIENDSYYLRLKVYKGLVEPDSLLNVSASSEAADLAIATQGYGLGNWYLCKGDTVKANEIFTRVVNGKHFSSFGFIAAEVELQRLK